jgi:hypothetical protein
MDMHLYMYIQDAHVSFSAWWFGWL